MKTGDNYPLFDTSMHVMPPKPSVLSCIGVLTCAAILAAAPQSTINSVPPDFPLSVWRDQKEVRQIPWNVSMGKATGLRADLRLEWGLSAWISGEDLQKMGGKRDDLRLFARVLERGNPVGDVYAVAPKPLSPKAIQLHPWLPQPVAFTLIAIVRPGKYKVELALLDQATGNYSTKFEDVTIEGNEDTLVDRALQKFSKFEFVPEAPREEIDGPRRLPMPNRLYVGGIMAGMFPMMFPPVLAGAAGALANDRPTFLVDRPGTTHVSVLTILNPPEAAIRDEFLMDQFQSNLTHLLSVFSRLEVPRGTAKLTGVDLVERTRVFDQRDMKDITEDEFKNALKKDTTAVSLDSLSAESSQGRFFLDVLKERLEAAENDISGARHAIIVVSANRSFPDASRLSITRARDCHCQVFYVRFEMVVTEGDHIDDLLKPYKPRVYQPRTWEAFREDFGKIYEQLVGR